jgi:hypothetical protein
MQDEVIVKQDVRAFIDITIPVRNPATIRHVAAFHI